MIAPAARPTLARLIRLLASNVDGEALGAVRALGRTLRACGCDFHDLASIVEAPPIAPNGGGRTGNGFHNHFAGDDDGPAVNWEAMVEACADQLDRFSFKEQQFIETLQSWYGEPTEKQLNWLVALFKRVRRAA
jgi:hypothetical protein